MTRAPIRSREIRMSPDRHSPLAPGVVPVRMAILDAHAMLLDSLASWIGSNAPDFIVTLRASTWRDLVHSPAFPTQLVLLDLQLKEPISIEARVRTCRAAGAKVIVLSSLDTPEARALAHDAGVAAFLPRTSSMREVMDVARAVMGVSVATRSWRSPEPIDATRPRLSAGESMALTLYVSGLTTARVAERMGVRYETAKTYLRRVREKYAKVNRPASKKAELAIRAAEDGYLE